MCRETIPRLGHERTILLTMTTKELIAKGYHHLSGPYRMPGEEEIFCRARAHLIRGGIRHIEVPDLDGDVVDLWSVPRVPPVPLREGEE